MSKLTECDVYLAMNEDGEYIVTADESEALALLTEQCGGYQARIVKVVVKMRPPVMVETSVTMSDDIGEVVAQP